MAELLSLSATMVKLTSSNYSIWKPRMEDILYCKDMYEPLQNGGEKPAGKSGMEWSILNRKVVAGIRQWVDESVFDHVAHKKPMPTRCGSNWSPYSWDTLVVSLSNSAPQGVLTLSTVKDNIFNKEARRKEQGILNELEALVTNNGGSSRKFHNRGKMEDRSRGEFSLKVIECFHCGGKSHMKRDCRKL
ncbi:hypothetical protein ACLB2K_038835 [Fragaria x ananassa]